MSTSPDPPRGRLLAWLQLFRIPNLFTSMADVFMGFLFVAGSLSPVPTFLLLLLASSCLYTAGMVLNDVYDVERDREERPERPIPSGRISLRVAMIAGYGLLAVGVACAAVAGAISDTAALPWRSVAVAAALAVSVVLYDAILKRTPLGPLAMGACRMLNVLLGMSLASANIRLGEPLVIGYSAAQLMAAGGIGVYITGVTWFARTEAQESNRLHLLGGTLTLLGGIALAAAFPTQLPALEGRPLLLAIGSVERWWLLMLLIAGLIGWRCVDAVTDPQPRKVQYAVKYCIWSLIVLDAVLATAVCGPVWGLVILALLLPTMTLGRFVYST